jgi:PAS domain S-box-containing protein
MGGSVTVRSVVAALHALERQLVEVGGEVSPDEATDLFRILDDLRTRVSRFPPPASTSADSDVRDNVERSLRITRASVDVAPISIFHLDDEGKVVDVNLQACTSLGYTRDELESLTIYDFNPTVTAESWAEHRAVTRATSSRALTTLHRRKDGTTFPVEILVKQFTFDGELYSVSFAKDITERLNAEQEKAKLESRMLQAQKLESLGVLAGGIAHDFNNLLMVILGNLDLALAEITRSGNAQPMLYEANQAGKQAADLCRQLLIYAGKGTSEVEPVDVGKLLREQARMLEVSASKSVRLLLNLAADLPHINADISQLRQVFMNLIINASDAIGQAAGVISISASSLACEREYLDNTESAQPLAPGRYVSVEVSDTGCGMDAAVRARIFDPFFSTKTASRGLGLAAVRGIVHTHGGGIRVYSEPGKGTTFRLLFPVPSALAEAAPASATTASWRGSGVVLLIDDEAALRRLGTRMLGRIGFDTLTASNGVEGLALFKEHRAKIQFVLLDWTMPELGGGETLRGLRQIEPDVRVILASGHAPDDLLRRVGPGPASALVRKPYTLDELARAFEEASHRT